MSPPVVKLSSDYKMEYGFPSAHAVNSLNIAVSFAYYYCNYSDPVPSLLQQTAAWACALTFLGLICISRVYCGMHTVTDIVGGLSLGLVLQLTFIAYFPMLDFWMMTSNNGTFFFFFGSFYYERICNHSFFSYDVQRCRGYLHALVVP